MFWVMDYVVIFFLHTALHYFFSHYRQHPLCVVKISFVLGCGGTETQSPWRSVNLLDYITLI